MADAEVVKKPYKNYFEKLLPLLSEKKRGDFLSDEEVLHASGIDNVLKIDGHIRKYFFRERNISIRHQRGNYYLMTDNEQLIKSTRAPKDAMRKIGKGRLELIKTDSVKLQPDLAEKKGRLQDLFDALLQKSAGFIAEFAIVIGKNLNDKKEKEARRLALEEFSRKIEPKWG